MYNIFKKGIPSKLWTSFLNFRKELSIMNKITTYIKENLFSIIMFLITVIFYLFFAFWDGAVICVDSPGYINMSFSREPFYPLLLAAFRFFSPENYLFHVVILQSFLMAFSGWILADYLRKKLKINQWYSITLYLLPMAASLLCRFAAKRASMYTNSIMTEGICTSLYLLFIYCILKYLWDSSNLHLISSWIIAFLMFSTRKQMLMVLPILFLAMIYKNLGKQKLLKSIITASIICLLIFPAFKLFDCTYNYILRGTFQGHSSSNRFVTTMVFYNAERSDAEYIKDSNTRQLFLDIYDVCDEKGYLGSHAGDGWYEEVNHFGDHYDHIQIDTMWPMILQHARQTITAQYQDTNISEEELNTLYDVETDHLNSIIIASVLPHQLPELVKSFFNNFLSGLMTTIAQRKPVFIPYTAIMLLLYLLLTCRLLWYWIKNNKHSTENLELSEKSVHFAIITLLGIFFNVFLVSVVIFCQTRYTIYNMPLFYMAGAILLYRNLILNSKS